MLGRPIRRLRELSCRVAEYLRGRSTSVGTADADRIDTTIHDTYFYVVEYVRAKNESIAADGKTRATKSLGTWYIATW